MERKFLGMRGTYDFVEKNSEIPLILAEAEKHKYVALDTENSGGLDVFNPDVKLLLLQLGFGNRAFVIDARKVDLTLVRDVIENSRWMKIIQYASYDYKLLKKLCGISIKNIYDTKLAESLLTAGISNSKTSLEDLSLKYLDLKLDKSTVMTFPNHPYDASFTDEQIRYAAYDVLVLPEIRRRQYMYLKQLGLLSIAELEFALIPVVAEMELRGVLLDAERWRKSLEVTRKKLFKISAELHQVLPDPLPPSPKPVRLKKDGTPYANSARPKPPPILNLDSWQQLADACKRVGINLDEANRKTRKGLTNADTLKYAQQLHSGESEKVKILKNIIKYRELNQVNKTFGENLIDHIRSDGRIHARFHQDGTVAGRFSCVPLDSEILTADGWKTYDQLKIGEKVVGYNIESNKLEWTTLHNIVIGEDVVGKFCWLNRLEHSSDRYGTYIVCTPNHKWVAESNGVKGFIESCNISSHRKHSATFTLWASGVEGNNDDCNEAALIGWAITDGSIKHLVNGFSLEIRVTKPTSIAMLDTLLSNMPHTESTYYLGRNFHYRYERRYYIGKNYFTPIWEKVLNIGLIKYIYSLTYNARVAMYDAMMEADGSPRKTGKPFGTQKKEIADAFCVLASLLGIGITYKQRDSGFIDFNTRTVRIKQASVRYYPSNTKCKVWCPTTGLGTWIMRQRGKIVITGNSSNPNLENIQKKGDEGRILRSCFIPPAGWKYIIADYSQLHLRIAAEISKDPAMLEAFSDPKGDIHKNTASQMFGVPLEGVTYEMRKAAKTINFGIIYGMGNKTLSERLGCSLDEAEELMRKYKQTYAVLMDWLDNEAEKALQRGWSRTMKGRYRWFPRLNEKDDNYRKMRSFLERVGKNHPILGTDADMLKTAMVLLHNPLTKLDAHIVNCVHDELVVEAPMDKAIQAAKLVKRKMIVAGQKFLSNVPVLVDVKIRDNWWKDDGVEDDENGQQLWLIPDDFGLGENGNGSNL